MFHSFHVYIYINNIMLHSYYCFSMSMTLYHKVFKKLTYQKRFVNVRLFCHAVQRLQVRRKARPTVSSQKIPLMALMGKWSTSHIWIDDPPSFAIREQLL